MPGLKMDLFFVVACVLCSWFRLSKFGARLVWWSAVRSVLCAAEAFLWFIMVALGGGRWFSLGWLVLSSGKLRSQSLGP